MKKLLLLVALNFSIAGANIIPGTYIKVGAKFDDVKRVDKLRVGDAIEAYSLSDDHSNKTIIREIEINYIDELVILGTNKGEICITPDENIFEWTSCSFKQAVDLEPGDVLVNSCLRLSTIVTKESKKLNEPIISYDIKLDGEHLFFICDSNFNGILVHNNSIAITLGQNATKVAAYTSAVAASIGACVCSFFSKSANRKLERNMDKNLAQKFLEEVKAKALAEAEPEIIYIRGPAERAANREASKSYGRKAMESIGDSVYGRLNDLKRFLFKGAKPSNEETEDHMHASPPPSPIRDSGYPFEDILRAEDIRSRLSNVSEIYWDSSSSEDSDQEMSYEEERALRQNVMYRKMLRDIEIGNYRSNRSYAAPVMRRAPAIRRAPVVRRAPILREVPNLKRRRGYKPVDNNTRGRGPRTRSRM